MRRVPRPSGASAMCPAFAPPSIASTNGTSYTEIVSAILETVLQDVRYAARGLRRSVAFTVVATTSIALGIAANATIFSVVNAALLRPIPGANADGLVRVYQNHHSPFQWEELAWFRDHARSFDYFVGERYQSMSFRAASDADAERARVSYVTRGFFPALGVTMALGRAFDQDDRDAGAPPVGVISYAFWQRRFAGDSSVLGRTVAVADHPGGDRRHHVAGFSQLGARLDA